jgi:hypothetical protein
MVFGAFVYRYGMPGGDGTDGGGGAGGPAAVVCAEELGSACDAVPGDVVVEPAAVTAKRLIVARGPDDAEIGGWIAPGPWPAMVDAARRGKPALFGRAQPLASTTLVAVARKGQLPTGCAPVTWKCLGDAAQDPAFRIGADPATTPIGLFTRAAALGGFFGRPDFATNDLDEQPDARSWYDNLNARLAAAAGFGAGSIERFTQVQGSARVYLTTDAAARSLRGNAQFEVVAPTATARVVTAFTPAADGGRRLDTGPVTAALTVAGWTTQGTADEGLPSPGVLLALSEVE